MAENLEDNILKQVEYYLSPQNLQTDLFLLSKMNAQKFVPLEVVAGFKLLRNLTTDVDLIKKVLLKSTKVQMEEVEGQCLIRPAVSGVRNTLILRDLPSDVPHEEIKAAFPNQADIVQLHPDVGNTWFITFANEEQCKAAFEYSQTQEIRGNPVKARIKSESIGKSFSQPPAASPEVQQVQNYVPYYYPFPTVGTPYPYYVGMGPYTGYPGAAPQEVQDGQQGQYARGSGRGRGGGRDQGRAGGRKARNSFTKSTPPPPPAPKLESSDFPPLPSSSTQTCGYDKAFKKYSKEEIIAVLTSLRDKAIPLPSSVPPDCGVLLEQPNQEIEITRPLNLGVEGEAEHQKTFAEAAITAKDIKAPEKAMRNSRGGPSRSSRNSRNSRPEPKETAEATNGSQ